MQILISDNLGEAGVQLLREQEGFQVDVKTGLTPDGLQEIIGQYDALIIRSGTVVTEALLESAPKLKVIGRAGIGLDNVDVPAATKRGIVVMNTPTGNVITTAEHTIAMMMALCRNIPMGTLTLKAGRWEKKQLQGREVYNKWLGVIGFGKIGSTVADRARGLRMRVMVYDPYVAAEQIEKAGFKSVTLDELFQTADFITVHVPKMKSTTGLIGRDAFARMKPGVMVVNCARGGIVDEAALNEAIDSGKVAGAALDVFETEPPGTCRLFDQERVICTPHLGASTEEAQTNVAVQVAGQIIDFLKTGTIVNAVNVPSITGELLTKLGPYLTIADRIGALQAQISRGPVKKVEILYEGNFNNLDLSPVSTAVLKGLLAPMVQDSVNFVNSPIIAREMGIKVIESASEASDHFIHLITVQVVTTDMTNTVAGTIYGKREPRIVKINNFGLELIPEGHLALIYNMDKPGAIGSIGTTLGKHAINISRMQVGQDQDGENNIIFLRTDTSIPDAVLEELRALPMVKTVTPLEF
ncbi:MAG TPA: phosphoglycerate dehydrogenase [Desulfobacterales bacterium]